jgi:FkbM family methyltransferase
MIFSNMFSKGLQWVPQLVVNSLYRFGPVAVFCSKILKRFEKGIKGNTVTIRAGELAGRTLQLSKGTPNYYWIRGHDEPEVIRCMKSRIMPGFHVVDVGAHVGIETMMFSAWVGSAGVVTAIEPDQDNFETLLTNLRMNGVANVRTIQGAIAARKGVSEFHDGLGVLSRLTKEHERGKSVLLGQAICVQTFTLDELFGTQDNQLNFVKIDVEDFEGEVLQGAAKLLVTKRPVFMIELHSHQSAISCLQTLRGAKYSVELVGNNEDDIDCFLAKQPQKDYTKGFSRCHVLATPLSC